MRIPRATWFSYPQNEALQQDITLLCKAGTKKEADFCIGPKIYGYLHQENFNSANVKIAQPVLCGVNREYLILKCKAWTYLIGRFRRFD